MSFHYTVGFYDYRVGIKSTYMFLIIFSISNSNHAFRLDLLLKFIDITSIFVGIFSIVGSALYEKRHWTYFSRVPLLLKIIAGRM